MSNVYYGVPGPGSETSQTFKEILASTDLQAKLPGGILLASGFGVLDKGQVLGKITASGKGGPYGSTVLTATTSSGAKALVVSDTSGFRVGDEVIVEGESGAIAIDSITDATHMTLASGVAADRVSGKTVKLNDGRETAVCILDNPADTTNNDVGASAFVAGIFKEDQIVSLDAAGKTALKLCLFV